MFNIHKKLMEKNGSYAKWHQDPNHQTFQWLILVLVSVSLTFFLLSKVNSTYDNSAAIILANNDINGVSINGLNNQLLHAAKAYTDSLAVDKSARLATLVSLAQSRKATMANLLLTNPKIFLLNSLPQSVIDNMPSDVQSYFEQNIDTDGTLNVFHQDDFKNKNSKFVYKVDVTDQDGNVLTEYNVHFAKGQTGLSSGAKVHVSGTSLDGELVLAAAGGTSMQTVSQSGTASSDLGVQKTLVMPVNFTDNAGAPYTQAQLAGQFFTDPDSVNTYYAEDSFGQTSFSGDVTPWLTVPYTMAQVCANPSVMVATANSMAGSAGYSVSNYSRRVYLFPQSGCPFGGMAQIGGTPSIAWIQDQGFGYNQETEEHELGHDLGGMHASTMSCGAKTYDIGTNCSLSEYGENYDPLGYYNNYNSNAPHKTQFGFIPSANVKSISINGTYTVAPLETSTTAVQALKIPKSDGGYYYVSYRQPVGRDASLSGGLTGGATIHYWDGGGNTYFLDATPGDGDFSNAALPDGATFTDTINGIAITQVSHSTTGATLQFVFTGPPCTTSNPSVALNPVTQTGTSGKTLSYSLTISDSDSSSCPATTYNVAASAPVGFTTTISNTSVSVNPGASINVPLSISSPTGQNDGSYQFSVSATDSASSVRTAGAVATYVVYTPVPDTIPPTVSISSPVNGSKVSGANVNISVSATDNTKVAKVEIYIDNKLTVTDSTSPYSYKWNLKKVASGTHTISAKAYDSAGNVGSASVSVTK